MESWWGRSQDVDHISALIINSNDWEGNSYSYPSWADVCYSKICALFWCAGWETPRNHKIYCIYRCCRRNAERSPLLSFSIVSCGPHPWSLRSGLGGNCELAYFIKLIIPIICSENQSLALSCAPSYDQTYLACFLYDLQVHLGGFEIEGLVKSERGVTRKHVLELFLKDRL